MSTIKVDTVRPVTTDGSLSLKGDSGGSATTNGISVDSNGDTSISGTTTIATADINDGTIDGTTIGGTTPAAGSFTDMAFNSGYGSVATAYACRAWVNFNGAFSDSSGQSGTYSCSGSTITITDNAHGLEVGDSIHAVFTRSAGDSVTITDDFFTVLTVPSADTFTIQTVVGTTDQSGTVNYDSDALTATAEGPIRASGNVSSITDGGPGIYTVNFTNAMPDSNYAVTGMKANAVSNIGSHLKISGTPAASSVVVESYENDAQTDCATVCVAVFR